MSLVTVPVRVEHGSIFSVDGTPLPESATALLVLLPSADMFPVQDSRADVAGLAQRDDAFTRFYESVDRHAQDIHLDDLTDEQLNELVHDARAIH